jgi:hypothetical protein
MLSLPFPLLKGALHDLFPSIAHPGAGDPSNDLKLSRMADPLFRSFP